jgi:hypothetical protein
MPWAIAQTARRQHFGALRSATEKPTRYTADYVEIDNRGNATDVYFAFNGTTATSTAATAITYSSGLVLRARAYSIERIFTRATSISALGASNATTIYVTTAQF